MAVKYGSGPRPAAHSAKRRFLNCLETSLTPSSTASKFFAQRPVSQGQNTMAVKYGSRPRPAAHSAKRRFLNCLETTSIAQSVGIVAPREESKIPWILTHLWFSPLILPPLADSHITPVWTSFLLMSLCPGVASAMSCTSHMSAV